MRTNSIYKADELFVVMPADERLMRELLMYKRTEKYIRQNISITQQEAVKRILTDKGFQNRERYTELQQRVQHLMGQAKLFVAGADIELGSEDAQTRVLRGFHELISRVYPNLRMLRGIAYTEEMIKGILGNKNGTLLGSDTTSLAESEQELLAFIQSNHRGGIRTTLKTLLEKFERKPYGWYYAAVLCTLAKLCARGKVEVRTDGNLLEEDALERALRNTHGHGNVVLEPQVEFTASQVRALKAFFADFFDAPPSASEAKALGKETGIAFQGLMHDLTPLAAQVSQYPFLNALAPVLETLKDLTGKPYTWYLTELARLEDTLLDMKEGVIDPIRKFISGPQKAIFDNARHFVRFQEPNFTYIEGDEPARLAASLADPSCFKGGKIQQMNTLLETLQGRVDAKVQQSRAQAMDTLRMMQTRMHRMDEYQVLPDVRRAELDRPYQDLIDHVSQQSLIAVINDALRYFEEQGYQKLLANMAAMARPVPPSPPDQDDEVSTDGEPERGKEPIIEYVHTRQVRVSFDKAWLADEADVDHYLASLRRSLLAEIGKGKRIQI